MLIVNRDFDLPESFRSSILQVIHEADGSDIVNYVAQHKKFRGGLKAVSKWVPKFKENLCKYFSSAVKINKEETRFLYDSGFGQQFITVLSYHALEYGHEAFRAFYDDEKFLLALLLDEREEIFSLGKSIIENSEPLEITSKEAALTLRDSYAPFLAHLSTLISIEKVTPKPTIDSFEKEIKILSREASQKKREADVLRGQISKERDIYQEKERAAEKKDKNKVGQLQRFQLEIDKLSTLLNKNKIENTNLKKEINDKIASGINARLHAISSVWFQKALQVEAEAQNISSNSDLLVKAKEAISLQAQRDHNIGNRQNLKERLSRLKQANSEIDDAISNALNLSPDLPNIARDISDEIIKLEVLLEAKGVDDYCSFAAGLIQRTKTCDSYEELHSIQDLAQTLSRYGLTKPEENAINDAICNKISLLIAMADGNVESLSTYATDRLRKNINNADSTLLFLDGHNIINLLPQFVESCQKNHDLGRQHLIEAITAFSQDHPHCRFKIVFDGPVHCREEINNQVEVTFSGGGDNDQRADNYILESISWVKSLGVEKNIYVVTNDIDLGRQSSDNGVGVIPVFYIEPLLGSLNPINYS